MTETVMHELLKNKLVDPAQLAFNNK